MWYVFFFQAEVGIRDAQESRGLGDVYKRQTQANPLYCSWDCRIKDKEHIFNNSVKGNLANQNKKGLNKLELAGQKILKEIGVDFQEQVLMFNKFLVDVLIPNKNVIIQWDGEYWHTKPKRVLLDLSLIHI